MERISLFIRTTKTEGSVKLRFRLIDGRPVQLYYTSETKADLKDLSRFEVDGTLKPRVTIYNHDLKAEIERIIAAMTKAYRRLCTKMEGSHISCELFEIEVNKALNPEVKPVNEEVKKESLLHRFERYIEKSYAEKVFADSRKRIYLSLLDSLSRFLSIKHLKRISTDELTADMLELFQNYMFDEYKYVERYPKLFADLNQVRQPKARRDENTVATRMKMLKAFFNNLLEKEEIEVSPFDKLGRKRRTSMLREQYESPRFLRKEEFMRVLETEVPESLQETKDAFLVQCNLGIRIGDFAKLSMAKVAVSEDGIPFVHYLPHKTLQHNTAKAEIETPLMLFALEIIKRREFKFPILNYAGGERGYNVKIKQLLQHCGIDRMVKAFDKEKDDNTYSPLWEYGSSKLCRSTHVDMMSKVQINLYATGLHSRGSNAVHHYTMNELRDRFALMCVAFGQPVYKADKDLNVIG